MLSDFQLAFHLRVLPGERYTVLITPPTLEYDGTFEVEYYDMVTGDYESSNFVRFRDSALDLSELESSSTIDFSPNPAGDFATIYGTGPWQIYDITGRKILEGTSNIIDLTSIKNGKYTIVRSNESTPFIVQKPN